MFERITATGRRLRAALRLRWVRRAAAAVLILGAGAEGLRQFINSPIQLFGDSVRRIDTADKVLALTFDDGPLPPHTHRMLDLLDQHHVKATFFLMGRSVERWPAEAREVLARGHEVGNHSYTHPRMVFMMPSRIRDEIERTDAQLRSIGVTGDILFSPPHGAKLVELPYVLRQMHRTAVYSYTDPEEWKRPTAEVMVARVLAQVRPGAVVGFHDVLGEETRRAVDGVLTALLADGYRFERMSEFLKRRAR